MISLFILVVARSVVLSTFLSTFGFPHIIFPQKNQDLFKHILQYLRTNEMPSAIGGFANNSMLWRDLRKEAEFFALDGLSLLLKITFSCMPDIDGGRGILHWLGE